MKGKRGTVKPEAGGYKSAILPLAQDVRLSVPASLGALSVERGVCREWLPGQPDPC